MNRRGDENYNIMVRLKPGVSVRQAQADIDVIAGRIREKDKRDRTFGMQVVGLQEQVVGDVRRALLVLLGSVALVLLIACANVANLLLTRAAGREKEVAIRTALGAGWRRLVRQLLTESILLAMLGGAAGLADRASGASTWCAAMNPGNIPRLEDIDINGAVLAFTFGVSLVTGILFGLAPAWRAIKVDLNTSLKAGGRSGQSDGGLHLARHRLRGLLVVSELALSLMLLIGAGLLIRSFVRLQGVPPGFTADHVLTMQVAATGPKYRDGQSGGPVFPGDREPRRAAAGSEGAGRGVDVLPLTGAVGWGGINVEGYTPAPGQELQVDIRIASTDYFRTMEIPLLQGAVFLGARHRGQAAGGDHRREVRAALLAARRSHRQTSVVRPQEAAFTIVGVVGVVKQYGLDTDGKIAIYFPQQQQPSNGMYLVARTSGDAAALSGAVVREIHAVDPGVAVYGIRTMQDRLYEFAGAAALCRRDAGRVCGIRAAAGGGGDLRRDVVPGDRRARTISACGWRWAHSPAISLGWWCGRGWNWRRSVLRRDWRARPC